MAKPKLVFKPKFYDEARILSKRSEGSYLFQRLRDEAHRFAINYNKKERTKTMVKSVLDDIEWVWPVLRKKLIKAFWSVEWIKKASISDLRLYMSKPLSDKVHNKLL